MADKAVGIRLPASRRITFALFAAAAVCALATACSASATPPSPSEAQSVTVGSIAPSFHTTDPLGGTVSVGRGEGRPVLLAFVNATASAAGWAASRAAGTLCASMATQYSARGLLVVMVDIDGPSSTSTDSTLINLAYDWHLGAVRIADIADAKRIATQYGITSTPTLVLISGTDHVLKLWTGEVPPAEAALAVQAALPASTPSPGA